MIDRPTLLHLLFGAEVGGCETTALAVMAHLPAVRHQVVVFGADGPMSERFRAAGAGVEFRPAAGDRALMGAARELCGGAAAAILWHGMVRTPPLIRVLNGLGVRTAVYGGNPAHMLPRRVDWRFLAWEILRPPGGPRPVYICCSKYVADSLESSRYLRRFPRAVVYNGVGLPPAAPRPHRTDAPLAIGMVARLNAIKDHATLIRAFAKLRGRFPTAVLELAGDGELRGDLQALAQSLGTADGVRFLGNVDDVYGVMAGWDMFVFSTTEREGMGSALAEAMMAGLPCVVSDIGPTREFASEGSAIALVPPGDPAALADAMEQLLADPTARDGLGRAAREFAMKRFHPVAAAREYARHLGLPMPPEPAGRPDGERS